MAVEIFHNWPGIWWQPIYMTPVEPPKFGWVCPRCGKVNAPYVAGCNCKPEQGE